MAERGIDAQGQVGLRVNQCAVQIENQQSNSRFGLSEIHAVSRTGKVPQNRVLAAILFLILLIGEIRRLDYRFLAETGRTGRGITRTSAC